MKAGIVGLTRRHVIENVMLNRAVVRLDGALRLPPK